eukprot:UN05240
MHALNNNIVSIIGGRVVLIPSIESLQPDLFPCGAGNIQHIPSDLTNLYCLNGQKRRLKNSSLKRSRTTFEPRYATQKTQNNHNHNHNHVACSRHKNNRNIRKPLKLSSLSLSKRRSVSCGALTVVKE